VSPSQVRFHDFELDPARFELRRAGRRIRLERKPMELLILLTEKQGRLVAREEIIERVWGKDLYFDAERGINNAIRKTRAALNDNPERPRFVETVVGKGYRFIAPIQLPTKTDAAESAEENSSAKQAGTRQTAPAQSWLQHSRAAVALAALLTVGLLAALGVITLRLQRSRAAGAPRVRSIAVLPFTNLSGDPSQEYFADGMTEELVTELGKVGALRVISHTSVNRFKGTKASLQEIAGELQVDALVEGVVARDGNRVRVTANLVQANPEKHLWAESYDRDLRNVLDLQSEIARAVADQIKITVTPEERLRLTASRPVDPESHELLLRGDFYIDSWTEAGFEQAIKYFEQSLQKEPQNARAYAGLALAYAGLGISDPTAYPKEKAAALKALEIDDTLSAAHNALAWAQLMNDWDADNAEREFRRAIALNPNDARAHAWYGIFLAMRGRIEESLGEVKRTRELDPLSLAQTSLAWRTYYNARDYDKAIEVLQNAADMDPNFVSAYYRMIPIYEQIGELDKAIRTRERAATFDKDNTKEFTRQATLLRKAYTAKGARGYWLQKIELLKPKAKPDESISLAALNARLGNKDEAFRWLEQAFNDHVPYLIWDFPAGPEFDSLRSDPRYADLLRRLVPRSE
jgi:TolB-like protein/DNA-binding winged helix-turn-helix (wHTH) protein/Tfp pilus assembly protein PilF